MRDDLNYGLIAWSIVALFVQVALLYGAYRYGVVQGKEQMCMVYQEQIRQLNEIIRPEEIRAWLRYGGE